MELFNNIFVFFLGAMMGSAGNALIDRLPRNESWAKGRSHCDGCGRELEWYDLLPIISYLYLTLNPSPTLGEGKKKRFDFRARCRYCGAPIPLRNLGVEIFMGITFLLIFNFKFLISNQIQNYNFLIFQTILLCLIAWVTVIIAVMDWETKLVSEVMVGIWALIILISNFKFLMTNNLLGILVGLLVIGGLWAVTRGRAMGFGDVEIAAVMGLALGWPNIGVALWMAFVSGAVVGLVKILTNKAKLRSEIPFGPFLILGYWVAFGWGETIIKLIF